MVFGDSFKITNIAILENKDKGELFVSMPRYRSNERDESNGVPDRAEAEPERVNAEIVYTPMVAEAHEYQYNADAFEARGGADVKVGTAEKVSKVREDKAR